MLNTFCKSPLWEVNRTLIRVAQGQEPADTVIKDANLVSVTTHEILRHADVAIAAGRIAYVGLGGNTADHCIGPDTRVIDASRDFIAPGFLDGHMHVESCMVGVSEYARAAVPRGTSGIFYDPHEMANVCGLEGVRVMMEDAKRTPLKAMMTTPSCVPAVPGFEDTGSAVYAADVEETMAWPETVALGEMMNFPGILNCEENAIEEVNATLKADKCVTGHYSIPETDRGLNAYAAAGIHSCHESVRSEDVLAKVRLGMYAKLREGSAWHNLKDLAPAIINNDIDTRLCCLITDDNHPRTNLVEGHIDRVLRLAVSLGIDPVTAIQMVTINTATCFHMEREIGSITPGKCADIVFLNNLLEFKVIRMMIDGEIVAEDGKPLFEVEPFDYPDFVKNSMHVGQEITAETFKIPAVRANGMKLTGPYALVRTMLLSAGSTIVGAGSAQVPIVDGLLEANRRDDVLKVFVFERHHETGTYGVGFAKGFGIHGALAQTVAHDAHNLIVMGDNDEDMALAANTLIACGGGEVAVQDGRVLGLVELDVAGLMSSKPIEEVSDEIEHLQDAWADMGCMMPSPFMTMSSMSLACIPELRLTNKGYVNCLTFQFEDLVI